MKFSIVCPIKDEVHLVPITLPSFYSIEPDEVILCLDKPAPVEVVKSIEKVTKIPDVENVTKIIEVERNPKYRFHQAWVRRQGFRAARNDAILTVDIDTLIDPEIQKYFKLLRGDVRLVSFAKFSLTLHGIVERIVHKIYKHHSFTGLYLFSKSAWLKTENKKSLKKIPRGEDTHLHNFLTEKYKDIFVPSVKNIVLRPKESKQYQYLMGWTRWKIRKTPIWKVFRSSLLYFRPYLFVGYIHSRMDKKKKLEEKVE